MADEKDTQIANLINFYINQARQIINKEGIDLVEKAWDLIKKDRQQKCLSDEISSSAEHYLTGRHLASIFSGPPIKVASIGYDALKAVIGPEKITQLGLGNDCPASELTARQTKWKFLGCDDGGIDRVLRTRKISPVSAENTEIKVFTGTFFQGL